MPCAHGAAYWRCFPWEWCKYKNVFHLKVISFHVFYSLIFGFDENLRKKGTKSIRFYLCKWLIKLICIHFFKTCLHLVIDVNWTNFRDSFVNFVSNFVLAIQAIQANFKRVSDIKKLLHNVICRTRLSTDASPQIFGDLVILLNLIAFGFICLIRLCFFFFLVH